MYPLYAIFVLLPATTLASGGCDTIVEQLKADEVALDIYNNINTDDDPDISSSEIDAYFKSFDRNNNTIVEEEELAVYVDTHYAAFKCHEGEVFNYLDFNHDHLLNETDFNIIIGLADTDKDSVITENEFVTVFTMLIESLEDEFAVETTEQPTNGTR